MSKNIVKKYNSLKEIEQDNGWEEASLALRRLSKETTKNRFVFELIKRLSPCYVKFSIIVVDPSALVPYRSVFLTHKHIKCNVRINTELLYDVHSGFYLASLKEVVTLIVNEIEYEHNRLVIYKLP